MNRTIVWFRRDLRVFDHAPLHRAAARGAVIPVFVLDRALLHHPETAVARVAFMLECLHALDQDLRDRGGRLILRSGDPVEILPQLVRETQAEGIYAYIDFERIYGRVRDARLNRALTQQQMKIRWFEPAATTPDLLPYPKYRELWYIHMAQEIVPAPTRVAVPDDIPSEVIPSLSNLGLIADGKPIPPGGIAPARALLQEFLAEKSDRYYWQLSYPGAEATSGLSPYIKFGAISVRECVQTTQAQLNDAPDSRVQRSRQQFIARLRWGSGFAQRFRYMPQLEVRSLYTVFDEDGWAFDEALYEAWQQGETGFPIVDAAARCLQETGGWKQLNFRVRAIYSSFLSNLLGMDWRYGALHFMRHLIDGDCPIDHYQWAMQAGVTHCVDKTWTRIYNPEQTAVDRCDPDGLFIKQWLPELAHLSPAELGVPPRQKDYPPPVLSYKAARQRRVQQLERQRQVFLNQDNVLPYLARLPDTLTPFGADLYASEIAWSQASPLDLFPPPLDLEALDLEQAKALRTWFVAHVDIVPRKVPSRKRNAKSKAPVPADSVQLNLLG
ncbi:deoxyribodipyrimidine photo-lyase [Thermoleptolyngbya sichuanensis A183]|uniref:Deoxyribodipyrimidine photo-lyase n=1 Tax=Thermoleptolyngbya sichuanensis A183 TaxID=2737172 RepID=A0A6M8B4R9_9CYAN|nr:MULTISPECIES: deoxyribodipyrimidine photo-lyase [Thermoleptolyngbya]QKD82269.1 deoxyribodipyrimidine photo-lyase [Thermoleptolyngbya sichuanensis A183]